MAQLQKILTLGVLRSGKERQAINKYMSLLSVLLKSSKYFRSHKAGWGQGLPRHSFRDEISSSIRLQRILASEESLLGVRREGRNGLSGNNGNIQTRGIFKIRMIAH